MLLKLVPTLPEGEHWLYEVKWDGYRAIAVWRMASLPFGPVMNATWASAFLPCNNSAWGEAE